eukprot:3238633-Pyramimonas_sp.AAC.1
MSSRSLCCFERAASKCIEGIWVAHPTVKIGDEDVEKDLTPLQAAVLVEDGEALRHLLAQSTPVDVNFVGKEPAGWTPLMFAADQGAVSMVELLLEVSPSSSRAMRNYFQQIEIRLLPALFIATVVAV